MVKNGFGTRRLSTHLGKYRARKWHELYQPETGAVKSRLTVGSEYGRVRELSIDPILMHL